MRIGTKKRPFYRVVVVDERAKRTGAYLELLGTYNPLTEPKDIKLKQDRIDHWTKQGAQMSTGFLRIIGKAPQRKPRKPKKEKKSEQATVDSGQEKTEEPKKEETNLKETAPATKESAEAPAEETKPTEEKPVTENEVKEVVDDSAAQTESTEQDTSESVQNKKNEGSA